MKIYWMQHNVRVTTFTIYKLSTENQQGKITPRPKLELKIEIFAILIL